MKDTTKPVVVRNNLPSLIAHAGGFFLGVGLFYLLTLLIWRHGIFPALAVILGVLSLMILAGWLYLMSMQRVDTIVQNARHFWSVFKFTFVTTLLMPILIPVVVCVVLIGVEDGSED